MSQLSRSPRPQWRSFAHGGGGVLLLSFVLALAAGAFPPPSSGASASAHEGPGSLVAQQVTPTPGGLQRGSIPAPSQVSNTRTMVCQHQLANIDRNRSTWSWLAGAVLFLVLIYALTATRRWTTTIRLVVAFITSIVLGDLLLALIIKQSLSACPDPPGFSGEIFGPVLWWTAIGGGVIALALALFRWLFVVRREFDERQASV